MTKLIVLSLTASAAVSMPGAKRLVLTGFSPAPVAFRCVNDNAAQPRPIGLAGLR
jgi:hypothetical protein